MESFDADLHLHSSFSRAVSDKMKIPVMAEQAGIKGLDVLATGDITNPKWRQHVRKYTEDTRTGFFRNEGTDFVLSAELEDENRVHHVLLFPDFESAERVQKELECFSKNINSEGRPNISASGQRIAGIAKDNECLFGPAHAFTPWTSLYKEHDSLKECYGSMVSEIDFLELGLSADTKMADSISELNDVSFVSNSDAHSPWPHRIGREFNRLKVEETSFEELEKAFHREKGRKISLNVGFDPREGKYHCSACQSCYQKYSFEQAKKWGWNCKVCGKSIKKGVRDRVKELADEGVSPDWRPDYVHLVPLAEIIKDVVGHSSVTTKGVQRVYDSFQSKFESEIDILVDRDISELEEVNKKVAESIKKFREEKTIMVPGGGGKYGELIIPRDEEERERIVEDRRDDIEGYYSNEQRSLTDF